MLALVFLLWLSLISSCSTDSGAIMTRLICDAADGEMCVTEGAWREEDGGREEKKRLQRLWIDSTSGKSTRWHMSQSAQHDNNIKRYGQFMHSLDSDTISTLTLRKGNRNGAMHTSHNEMR